jgi:hypothetical protein
VRNTIIGDIPRHHYIWVDTYFTHKEPVGFVPAVWFGLVSYPGRMWGLNVMLESGAIYRNVPPHGIAFSEEPANEWYAHRAQTWDCYGEDWSALEYKYLSGLKCVALSCGQRFLGEYLFTAVPIGDGFSAYPEQAKEFTFIKTDGDRLTIQPTNHVVFEEVSFTKHKMEFPKGLKRQTDIYRVE